MPEKTTEQKVAAKVAEQPSIATKPATQALPPWMGVVTALAGLLVAIPQETWTAWLTQALPSKWVMVGMALMTAGLGIVKNWLAARKAANESGGS